MTRSTPASALAQAGGGFGLVGARERVTALGGTLQAAARPSRGWHVQATLPLPPPATR